MIQKLTRKSDKGFTLLELLIVIAIIAILAVIIILVLDPAETLRKSRDAQRLSDLATIKTALGIYVTSTTTPYMGGAASNSKCKGNTSDDSSYLAGDEIFYSLDTTAASISDDTLDGGTNYIPSDGQVATAVELGETDGTGWIPVNLNGLTSGSPISNFPTDPVNTIAIPVNGVASTDLVYRYVCSEQTLRFEINAQLESIAYTTDDNKRTKDGGNNANYYEVGTDLSLLGTGMDF